MVALIGLLGALALSASAHAARVVDDTGATVELASPARRIVTLAPHAAELVASAGAASKLVAVGERTDFPREARALPIVGDANAIDVEAIVALAPDLVVTWPWTAPAQVARLRDRGIAVFTTAPTPVITAQPNSAAISGGRSRSTRTAERADTTVISANAETPR